MGEFYGNQYTESNYSDYEYEDLVEDVAALAEELGRPPTTEDANQADGLPSIATFYQILEDDWASTLRDAGIEPTKNQRRSVPTDRRERMLEDLRRTNRETEGDALRLRQYDDHGSFDGSSMKARFGSWSEACAEAGIECGTRHGIQCTGPQGNRLDSQHERLVAVFLDDCGIEYVVHPDVGDLGYEADFYCQTWSYGSRWTATSLVDARMWRIWRPSGSTSKRTGTIMWSSRAEISSPTSWMTAGYCLDSVLNGVDVDSYRP